MTPTGREAGLALKAGIRAAHGFCPHDHTEPVVITGETEPVAQLCVDCLDEVPLWWSCSDCTTVEHRRYCDPWPVPVLNTPCPAHR